MIKKKRTIIYIILVCMVFTAFFTGCKEEEDMGAQEECDFSIFFGDANEAIEIDAMLTEYEENTGVKIHPIITSETKDSESNLKSALQSEDAPAAYAAYEDVDIESLSAAGFVADFTSLDSEQEGNNMPYAFTGYGFAYDRAIFDEIFGEKTADKLIEDLKKCTYDQWNIFVSALDTYIKDRGAQTFSINGNTYKFPKVKGELAENLNGVFAFPGADGEIYGQAVMDIAVKSTSLKQWAEVEDATTFAAFSVMNPTLNTYIDGLDFITSYLSGEYSSGIRGSDFANEEYYSRTHTDSMFMTGKAVFSIIHSDRYSEIEPLNAKKATTLAYLPIKLPYDKENKLNYSLPTNISYSLYVNGTLPEETQKKALDFLTWFSKQEEKWSDPLTLSLRTYVDKGNVFRYGNTSKALEKWEENIFEDKGVRTFLRREIWNDEYKEGMKVYLVEKWCDE